jgi:signal peptidase I
MEDGDVRRHAWVAAILSLFSVGLGYVYLGKAKVGIAFLVAVLVAMYGLTSLIGHWRFGYIGGFSVAAVIWIVAVIAPMAEALHKKTISSAQRPKLRHYFLFFVVAVALGMGFDRLYAQFGPYKIFSIPSAAMSPNVLVGDYVVVKKLLDGERRLQVEPGTIIVFWNEESLGEASVRREYIKRVVATSGQEVGLNAGEVSINGNALPQEYLDTVELEKGFAGARRAQVLTEVNGASHYSIYDIDLGSGRLDNVGLYQVPEGHYFVLGDNRDRSLDSRVISAVGYVASEDVIGEALYVAWSFKDLNRIGKRLD